MKNRQTHQDSKALATKQTDVFAPPKTSLDKPQKSLPLYADGKFVVTTLNANWGTNCCYCNKKTQNTLTYAVSLPGKINLLYYLIFVFVVGLIGNYFIPEYSKFFPPFICVILFLALTFPKSTINFPACDKHQRVAHLSNKLSTIVSITFLINLITVYWLWDTGWEFIVGLPILFLIGSVLGKYKIYTLKKDEELYWFCGIGKEFRDQLPKYDINGG